MFIKKHITLLLLLLIIFSNDKYEKIILFPFILNNFHFNAYIYSLHTEQLK